MNGQKTYLVAAIMAVMAFLKAIGLEVPQSVQDALLWLLGAAGLASLRSAVSKSQQPAERTEKQSPGAQ